ncbi:uncharacterized oxidoreductase TM_0325-like [Battus philenor]|uniref:uncharacterized oxidoreductase TM_0325-like n=1 Tax=Battus philenor TaxID=42288 RepID=UPI0035D0A39E
MDFQNKVVIVTGASGGIGASAAILFASQSAKLVLVGRNETTLKEVAGKCEGIKGFKPLAIAADLTNDEDVKRIIVETIEHFDRIDVIVNNAGVGIRGCLRDGVHLLDRAMAINVRSAYLLTSLATPYLVKSKGNVVNVSSTAGIKPIKGVDYLPYCVSKAALDQFTKCVALELGTEGVRVNSVNPGGTKTAFAEAAGFNKEQTGQLYQEYSKTYPLRKMATSEEVADVILYLASDRASSITGAIFVIDNGELLT